MKIHKTILATVLLALLAVAAVAVAGVIAGVTPARAGDPVVLTVSGNGVSKTFTMSELKAITPYSGYSGFVNSAGTVYKPEPIKGVKLTELLATAGVTMTTLNACDVTAPDNYGMTFTYDNVMNRNGVQWYNADTKQKEDSKADWDLIVAYEENGSAISPAPSGDGPLRLVIAQQTDTNQIVDGHLLVKWVSKVNLRGAVADWKVKMYGLKKKNRVRQTYTLDRSTFDSCATPNCHGASWLDPKTKKTWSGVPLFLCIGKVDGGPAHDSYNAYNEALALKGYRIKLVSANGKSAIIGSRTARNRVSILLANKLMGSELTSSSYPLKLVGPAKRVPKRLSIGRITKIYLLPK